MRSLKRKILLGFITIILLALIIGGVNYLSIKSTNNQTEKVIEEQLPLLLVAEELSLNISERTSFARGYLLYEQQTYYQSYLNAVEEGKELEDRLLALSTDEKTEKSIERLQTWENLLQTKVIDVHQEMNKDLARSNFKSIVEPIGVQLREDFIALSQSQVDQITESGKSVIDAGDKSALLSFIIAVSTVIFGLILAVYVANSLTRPIIRVVNRMKLVADGDLTQEDLKTRSKDELGELVASVNIMTKNIRKMAREIGGASQTVMLRSEELSQSALEVNAGSEQVATTMGELSIAAETQAQSSSDLVESMLSLTANIHHANENGQQANTVVNEVLELTARGNEAMSRSIINMESIEENVRGAVEKVQQLDERSKEITQLVDVISGIADQTNLLALNATIEAARAGEHGRGFAVVASEVKKLSEQVANSITNITDIVSTIQADTSSVVLSLNDSFDQVELGTDQMKITENAFDRINDSVQQVVEQIQTISVNLNNIAESTDVMNDSISNIASISEEASAGIEETAASAEQTTSSMQEIVSNAETLSRVAVDLDQSVRRFTF
ncbi:methyl-accepting chemotaxis protein [Pseudogracilibacillus auburnensis]|uniref:methyl-accepting chemotaxis protein n=1 Tax=Pseudogracilibacillus auburnensis TaxID=1494959 RepID=UPI001A968D88|nr:methyl-accepting chemotaxis protein [Pseudogracilibacillus auburnensis]MBO1003934.1 methyl-accepting chemotaxis protein [Pseudogracilibacillus auburnensis]